ncbi:uncharacterized protein LOC108468219 [Gossypium arboreum]|uniref:uncharacterized protein LOC108468219 n=1 Tax=Gossypium arboreum TaxID=29729 RepID=UPI0008196635|nr:uncharacterized protein LOC108468219 [Gossypium arboreum]
MGWKQVEGFSDFFVLCNNVQMVGFRKRLWLIAIAAACWTIWFARNGLIFDNRRVCMENLMFLTKMRALLWIRSIHDEIMLKEDIWWISPLRCRLESAKSNFAVFCRRSPPVGKLKFIVNGVEFKEKAGYGGILRDMEGSARALFSGAVVTNIAEEAEIGVVKIALDVFVAVNWKPKESLFIEVGSVVAFAWCVNKALRPLSLLPFFAEIESAILKVGNVVFSLVDRIGNVLASSLAMAGVNRQQMFKAWW